jgi:hypothetical protein
VVPLLIKHPLESRTYTFDFNGGVTSPQRGTLWCQRLLGINDSFSVGVTLPLLFGSMLALLSQPTITVARSDGFASDLEVDELAVAGSQVSARLTGGTSGLKYTLTVSMLTNQGNLLVMQGVLLVTSSLP